MNAINVISDKLGPVQISRLCNKSMQIFVMQIFATNLYYRICCNHILINIVTDWLLTTIVMSYLNSFLRNTRTFKDGLRVLPLISRSFCKETMRPTGSIPTNPRILVINTGGTISMNKINGG
uniref:Asparaginase n=1 Tax=Ascaris lumbricoides TaxID=6252 RepID=A0A0M3IX35_ASCLU